jgi:hypothetical protein
VRLTQSAGMQVTFGDCSLEIGDPPTKEAVVRAATSSTVSAVEPARHAAPTASSVPAVEPTPSVRPSSPGKPVEVVTSSPSVAKEAELPKI